MQRVGFNRCCHLHGEIGKMGADGACNGLGCVVVGDVFIISHSETGKMIL